MLEPSNHTLPSMFQAFWNLQVAAVRSMLYDMQAIGYVRVSTDQQAEQGVSLEAQEATIRAMATVQGADLRQVVIDGGESAKSLNCPGLQRLLGLVNGGKVQAVIVAKLDRLTRSVKDLCGLLELFEKRKVALISVAESLDTGSAAGRLVITIMAAVSQWEREAIGERTTRRATPQARQRRARRQHRVRLSVVSGSAASGAGPRRAGRASGDSEFAPPGPHTSRHSGDPE
jgi:DNA invertase Pin-like site-specific DNA recombinase